MILPVEAIESREPIPLLRERSILPERREPSIPDEPTRSLLLLPRRESLANESGRTVENPPMSEFLDRTCGATSRRVLVDSRGVLTLLRS